MTSEPVREGTPEAPRPPRPPVSDLIGLDRFSAFYLGRERSLLIDDMADDYLALIVRARWIAIAVNLVAVVIAIAAPLLAVVLYVLMTRTIFVAPLLRLRRRRT